MNNTVMNKKKLLLTNFKNIVQSIDNGCITIIIQDGYAIQINILERIEPGHCLCRG